MYTEKSIYNELLKSLKTNMDLDDYKFNKTVSFWVDKVRLVLAPNCDKVIENVTGEVTKQYMKSWKQSEARILIYDLNEVAKGRETIEEISSKYFTYVDDSYRYLLRVLDKDVDKLINAKDNPLDVDKAQVVDREYVLMSTISANDPNKTFGRVYSSTTGNVDYDPVEIETTTAIALFDDDDLENNF